MGMLKIALSSKARAPPHWGRALGGGRKAQLRKVVQYSCAVNSTYNDTVAS